MCPDLFIAQDSIRQPRMPVFFVPFRALLLCFFFGGVPTRLSASRTGTRVHERRPNIRWLMGTPPSSQEITPTASSVFVLRLGEGCGCGTCAATVVSRPALVASLVVKLFLHSLVCAQHFERPLSEQN
eukprot:RCo032321